MKAIFIRRAIQFLLLLAILLPLRPVTSAQLTAQDDPSVQLQVLRSDEHGLLLELVTGAYTIQPVDRDGVGYDALLLDEASFTTQPGSPQLPQVSALIGVPPEAGLRLNILAEDLQPVPGTYRLPPVPAPAPLDGELVPGRLAYQENALAYASLQPYPGDAARLVEAGWQRDRRIARLELFPFEYIPAQGRLTRRSRLLVEVIFEPGTPSRSTPIERPSLPTSSFDMLVENSLLNAAAAQDWRLAPSAIPGETLSTIEPMTEPAYRIPIQADGLYRLTYTTLQQAGLDVETLDPLNFHLSSQGQPVAFYAHNLDGDEHNFSPGEYLAFYGQKFTGERQADLYQAEDDHWLSFNAQNTDGTSYTWTPQITPGYLKQYTDQNVYWLSLRPDPGLAMAWLPASPGDAPLAQTYRHTVRAEQSVYWVANQSWTLHASEDTWFWNRNYTTNPAGTTWVYPVSLSGVASGAYTATLRGEVISVSTNDAASPDHHTLLYLNDSAHTQPVDDHTWDGRSRYRFETSLPQNALVDGANSLDFVAYKTDQLVADDLYFDWYEIEYQRLYQAEEDEIIFSPGQAGAWRYQVSGYQAAELGVLDITSPLTPTWLTGVTRTADTIQFEVSHPENARFYAGKFSDIAASQVELYRPPDPALEAGYLVIAHADFSQPAQRLADYRQAQGFSTRVIDIQNIYNQFNYGIFNPLAVKRFLKYAFEQWSEPPEYLLLVGDGTWNFKNSPRYNTLPVYMPPNLAWVDPWSGVIDSANSLAAVVGDDILPDLFVGRIPVNTSAELDAVVDKIIAYEAAPRQDWQRNLLFIADNVPDPAGSGDFVQFSENIIADYAQPGFTPIRIYENDYACPFSNACPQVNHAITTTLNQTGTLLVNYIGHGAINRWSNESILLPDDLSSLSNDGRLPVVLSMTCLDGHWYHPGIAPNRLESLMEEMLRASGKGMLASFSPTGFGVTTGHDWLNRGFYDALFNQGLWSLGQAAEAARLYLYATGSNLDLVQTFTIFGDPALRMKSPYSLTLDPPAQFAAAGEVVTYTLQLTNDGAIEDSFQLALDGNAWPVTVSGDLLVGPLLPGEAVTRTLQVAIPLTITDGQSDLLTITATSQGDSQRQSQVTAATTGYYYALQLSVQPLAQQGQPGEVLDYTLLVKNPSQLDDTYDLSQESGEWPASLGLESLALPAGGSASVLFQVQVPSSALPGGSDQAVILARSEGDPALTVTVQVTSTLRFFRIYLPEIER